MGHSTGLSPEEQRKADKAIGVKGFWILLIVTFAEVAVALFTKDLLPGVLVRLIMIAMSLFKAYYIVSIFMHLGHEIGGFASTVVMPMTLLIWGCIAFLWEGDYARHNRNYVKDPRPGAEAPAAKPESSSETSMKTTEELSKEIKFM